ncbi:hypothetical protein HYQ45_001058 [Verticillium longisporum]|uniref:Uncharacterized protein n=1 Tax=Verticillium longisporum TaxID=100787 RepID=A0A8I3AWZ9_VERLO|nr:hypothetical protein HYQ45_001058 [Verticillium longisporum]
MHRHQPGQTFGIKADKQLGLKPCGHGAGPAAPHLYNCNCLRVANLWLPVNRMIEIVLRCLRLGFLLSGSN